MLTVSNLNKSYAGRTLFADASFQVNRGDRIGVVGPNGAGKSTLFGLLLGTEAPDSGAIAFHKNTVVGHLPQETAAAGDESVLELATSVSKEFHDLRRRVNAPPPDMDPGHEPAEWIADRDRFEELGGREIESRAKKILHGLGFRETDFARPLRQMSGGWIMRSHLARLLVQEPDLLMLDEPTNHLDLEALLWLQGYLKSYPGAILLISHDREFLNQLVGGIFEVTQAKLRKYTGNYDDFLNQREAQAGQIAAAYKNQQREIARLMQFVDRFRAKNTKASQAQSKLKQIERMDKVEAPEAGQREVSFRFPQPQRSGLKVIQLAGVHHAYGNVTVYSGLDFLAQRGQRIVLVGPNGAGKSTLLKLLAQVITPQQGEVVLGHNVCPGYYSQFRTEMLHAGHTVLEEALDTTRAVSEQSVRTLLGCFLFSGDDVFKKVQVLSGGEKSRLALVKILLNPPNLLLMDEPTTHLDMASIDALVAALSQFEGTLIFISHDVYFIRAIAREVIHVENGALTHYPGPYDYYLDKKAADAAVQTRAEPQSPPPARSASKSKEQKRAEAEERQARFRETKARRESVERIEKEIARLEARQREILAEIEDPELYKQTQRAAALNRELADLVRQLKYLTREWEDEASKLA